jgi:hypothetical protein
LAEIHSTTVFGDSLASLLKRRTEAAQTDVSKLKKMFNIMFLPAKSARVALKRDLSHIHLLTQFWKNTDYELTERWLLPVK